jgi:hypothetical protein
MDYNDENIHTGSNALEKGLSLDQYILSKYPFLMEFSEHFDKINV